MCPDNILTDDCSPEREGLNKTWPSAKLFLCVFHFYKACGDGYGTAKIV